MNNFGLGDQLDSSYRSFTQAVSFYNHIEIIPNNYFQNSVTVGENILSISKGKFAMELLTHVITVHR